MGRLRLMACTEVRFEEGVLICEFVSPFTCTVNTVLRPSRGHGSHGTTK